jgi:hypothetical protein
MTTFAQVTNAARTAFRDLVATPLGISFAWDNAEFTPPSPWASESRYCAVAVRYDPTVQSTYGATTTFTKVGHVNVDIYSPIARMDQPTLEVFDAVTAAFRELDASGVTYRATDTMFPPVRDGERWRAGMAIPFESRVSVPRQSVAAGSTGYESVGNTIRTRFKTAVADPQGVPVIWDNQDAELPTTGLGVRFAVRFGASQLRTLGARHYQTTGVAIAMIFAQMRTGDRDSLDLADAIDAQFRAVTDGGVTFLAPTPRVIGQADGRWQTNVVWPFQYREVVTS